ncbi:hypothetical protein THH46_31290 [Pseudomonas sp. NA13]
METVQRLLGRSPMISRSRQCSTSVGSSLWEGWQATPVAVRPVKQFIDVFVAGPIEGEDKGAGVSEVSNQCLTVYAQVLVGTTVLEQCLTRVTLIF